MLLFVCFLVRLILWFGCFFLFFVCLLLFFGGGGLSHPSPIPVTLNPHGSKSSKRWMVKLIHTSATLDINCINIVFVTMVIITSFPLTQVKG